MTTMQRVAACVVATEMEGVRERELIHYSQDMVLRWEGIHNHVLGPKQARHYDCSSRATWSVWQARIRIRGKAGEDVINSQAWKSGNTASQIRNGRRHKGGVSWYKPGRTFCFYRNSAGEIGHVAVYVGNGMVVSHGSEAGPLLLPYNYRTVAYAICYRI